MDSLIDPVSYIKANMADFTTTSRARVNHGTFAFVFADGSYYHNKSRNINGIINLYRHKGIRLPTKVKEKIKQGIEVKLYIKTGDVELNETLKQLSTLNKINSPKKTVQTPGSLWLIQHTSGHYFIRRTRKLTTSEEMATLFIRGLSNRKSNNARNANTKLNSFITEYARDILTTTGFVATLIGHYSSYIESIALRKQTIENHGIDKCLNRHYAKGN